MKHHILRFRWRFSTSLALTGIFACSLSSLMSEPPHPSWWTDRGILDNAVTPQNKGVTSIGQLKHVATQAHAELEDILPGGAGFNLPFDPVPSSPDAAWYETQKKVLNLGQLKAIAEPFYNRLNEISPAWVKSELQTNGLTTLDTHYFQDGDGYIYPWNPVTPVADNYKLANVGQVKVVFAIRFNVDTDNDTLEDLLELSLYGDLSGDGTGSDYDGDGLADAAEKAQGTSLWEIDTDHDGIIDGDDSNPLVADNVTVPTVGGLQVFTPLN